MKISFYNDFRKGKCINGNLIESLLNYILVKISAKNSLPPKDIKIAKWSELLEEAISRWLYPSIGTLTIHPISCIWNWKFKAKLTSRNINNDDFAFCMAKLTLLSPYKSNNPDVSCKVCS